MCAPRYRNIFSSVILTLLLGMLNVPVTQPAEGNDRGGVLKASELIGMKVQNSDGTNLGEIKDLVIDPEEGDVEYAVLDFGGLLGVSDKYFAVPWDALELNQASKKLTLDVNQKDLKKAPGFDKDHWPNFSERQRILLYEFYDVPLPPADHKSK